MFRKPILHSFVFCLLFASLFGSFWGCDGFQQARTCVPSSQRICACIDGFQGVQACNEEGTEWSACRCKGSQIEGPTQEGPTQEAINPSETSIEVGPLEQPKEFVWDGGAPEAP